MLKILLEDLIATADVFKGLKLEIIYRPYITGATYSADDVHFDCDTKFSEKSLIAYLCGYVFGVFYHRVRFSKTAHQNQTYHQRCLSFSVAGKCAGETISLPEHRYSNFCFLFTIVSSYGACRRNFKIVPLLLKLSLENIYRAFWKRIVLAKEKFLISSHNFSMISVWKGN